LTDRVRRLGEIENDLGYSFPAEVTDTDESEMTVYKVGLIRDIDKQARSSVCCLRSFSANVNEQQPEVKP